MFDVGMISKGKEKFKDLYAKSKEDRQKLRETDGYRQALLDLYEMAAASVVYRDGKALLGEVVIKLVCGEFKVEKNIDDK